MIKYTLYKASRFSKISRYKLEQAIEQGLLNVCEGKGNVKYYINEDDLKLFLENHGDQFIHHRYEDDQKYGAASEMAKFTSNEVQQQIIDEKERVILLLEKQLDANQSVNKLATSIDLLNKNLLQITNLLQMKQVVGAEVITKTNA